MDQTDEIDFATINIRCRGPSQICRSLFKLHFDLNFVVQVISSRFAQELCSELMMRPEFIDSFWFDLVFATGAGNRYMIR